MENSCLLVFSMETSGRQKVFLILIALLPFESMIIFKDLV